MSNSRHQLDRARLASAAALSPENHASFQRLCKSLLHGPAFQLLLIDCRDERLQQQLLTLLEPVLTTAKQATASIRLGEDIADVFALEALLQQAAGSHEVIHLLGAARWLDERQHPGRWAALNVLRERIATQLGRKLLWWLDEDSIAQMVSLAPDWWAWRGGIFTFSSSAPPLPAQHDLQPRFAQINRQSQEKAAHRIAELHSWLAQDIDPELALPLQIELGDLLQANGQLDAALQRYQQHALPLAQDLADDRTHAILQGRIAEILFRRGQYDEVLRIRQQEELPVYQHLGDTRSIAITQGRIADILYQRGQYDEALRIRQQEELPVYLRLGDTRSIAITLGKIASILTVRGRLDEALHIHQQEQLPALQHLGDTRGIAITQGQIANILSLRGQLAEALRIRQQEQLPAFQRLGDSFGIAITQGKIADILIARNQLDEALSILQGDVLPALQRLNDTRSIAVTISMIADILFKHGQHDEALRLYQEQLPVFQQLGDAAEMARCQATLAQMLWLRDQGDDRQQAQELIQQALAESERLQLADTAQIREVMQNMGLA